MLTWTARGKAATERNTLENTPRTAPSKPRTLSTARPAAARGRHSSPHLWGERACLLIRVSWAPVGERDKESTPTTSSHIKIEPFIQDPEQGLLILSKQMGYKVQGGSCPGREGARWATHMDVGGQVGGPDGTAAGASDRHYTRTPELKTPGRGRGTRLTRNTIWKKKVEQV